MILAATCPAGIPTEGIGGNRPCGIKGRKQADLHRCVFRAPKLKLSDGKTNGVHIRGQGARRRKVITDTAGIHPHVTDF